MNIESLKTITDPRNSKNQVYSLESLLLIIFASTLSGFDALEEMVEFAKLKFDWLNQFVPLKKVPCVETLRYFLCSLNPNELIRLFDDFSTSQGVDGEGENISIDGKTIRGTARTGMDALHVISVWSSDHGITLAMLESKGKKNEIKMIPEVIDLLDVKGAVITTDAMGCQKVIASKVIDKTCDYCLQIKANQSVLFEQIKAYHHRLPRADTQSVDAVVQDVFEEVDKEHGRIEPRRYTHFSLTHWIDSKAQWLELRSVILVERTRHIDQKEQAQRSWYISSLDVDAKRAATAIRSHWQVENPLHWWLDVVYGDDRCQLHSANGALNMTAIKRYCMNLLTKDTTVKRKKHRIMAAAVDDGFRERLLFG